MKRVLLTLAALALSGPAAAAGGTALPYSFKPDVTNLPSLQRGARNYMNYCAGCHSMKHLRYSRLAQDLNIPEGAVKEHLMFTTDKTGDPIRSPMPAESAKWFGQVPPDLTVETRKRGPDWVFNYLMTFYLDPARPNGVNNLVLPGASMPHVLWELQGWQVKPAGAPAVEGDGAGGHAPEGHAAQGDGAEGHGEPSHEAKVKGHRGSPLQLVQQGKLSPEEYKKFVTDTVNFMHYAAEPARTKRITTGIGVILFLLVLTTLSWFMKREWWRDVH